MMQENEHINDLIVCQLTGDIDDQGRVELQQWLSQSVAHEQYYREQQELWFSAVTPEELSKYHQEEAFEHFKKRIQTAKASPSRRHWLSYAAAACLLIFVSYASYRIGQHGVTSELANITIEAPQGSRTQLTLPDGSQVWLNAGSRMTYSQGFGISDRSVTLAGEGYFEVAKNAQLPFSVSSDNMTVRVLGTKFNFRDYPNDSEVVVTLTEGRVALNSNRHQQEETQLAPGHRAVMDKASGSVDVEVCEAQQAATWTQGLLTFDGETLEQIVHDLERSYNVTITIADSSLKQLHFYGDFLRQEQTLSEVLDALSATGKVRYRQTDREVTLY